MMYSVVVLMYHRAPELVEMAKDCVASIKRYSEDYELIIVDNGSTENEEWAQKEADTYIRFSENRGISPGWNAGMRASRGQYVVVCNDDILVCEGWLKKMRLACSQPFAGMGQVHVEHLPPGIGIESSYKWPSGACFMLPKTTIEKIGYFDEQFFPCNWEDVDYWTRLLLAGLKIYVNHTITIQHREGATLHEKSLSRHFMANKQRYIDKWGFDCTPLFFGQMDFNEAKTLMKENV